MKQLLFMASSIILLALLSCREDEDFIYPASQSAIGTTSFSRRDSANVNDNKGGD